MIEILIENYIPFGYEKRISRSTLQALTHQSDRKNREEMETALLQRDVLIINIDNGYFRPDGSMEDTLKAKFYLRREQKRTFSNSKRCKAIENCLKPPREDDISKNQMSLADFGIG